MYIGEWEAWTAPNGGHIWCGETHIADTDGEDALANTHLIVAAVNACIKLNPIHHPDTQASNTII